MPLYVRAGLRGAGDSDRGARSFGRRAETRTEEIHASNCLAERVEKSPVPGLFEVERTGIEPVTSGLQSRRSPS